MIYSTTGQLHINFLQFTFTSFYYSTGYPIAFLSSNDSLDTFFPTTYLFEPYPNYLKEMIHPYLHQIEMNRTHVVPLLSDDMILIFPISNKGNYLGTIIVGPILIENAKKVPHSNELIAHYLDNLTIIHDFQVPHIVNLMNLIFLSSFYIPTSFAAYPQTKNEENLITPGNKQLSNQYIHHTMDEEETIVRQILSSDETLYDIAVNALSGMKNMVVPPLANNPLRSEKNRFIVSATVLSREAIKLGLPSEISFSHSDQFINDMENCETLREIANLQNEMNHFYRNEIQKNKSRIRQTSVTSILISYIENNIETNCSLQEICKQLKLDYKYASNSFIKDTGIGFNKYLNKEKIKVAKRELSISESPIQEIATLLGYNSSYYFSRAFKLATGQTPSEYRKRTTITP